MLQVLHQKTVRRLPSVAEGDDKPSVSIKTSLQEFIKKEGICMILISLESVFYIVNILAIFCGIAYKAGHEAGKNAKK